MANMEEIVQRTPQLCPTTQSTHSCPHSSSNQFTSSRNWSIPIVGTEFRILLHHHHVKFSTKMSHFDQVCIVAHRKLVSSPTHHQSNRISISTHQTAQLFATFLPSKRHQNQHKPITHSRETHHFNIVTLDKQFANQQHSLQSTIISHLLSQTTIDIWLPKRNQILNKIPYFPFIFPSFHPVFCFRTASLYFPSNDSRVAMKHTSNKQHKVQSPTF